MSSDVWESTASKVDKLAVVLLGVGVKRVDILPNYFLLVPRALEVIAESPRGCIPANFWPKTSRPADTSDVRTACLCDKASIL
jgi:hypothetical protein